MGGHTTIDNTNIHRERIRREIRHISRIIAEIAKTNDPMRNSGPDARPRNDLWVHTNIVQLDDVVDCVIEERDETGDTDDGEGLCGEEREDKGS